MRTVTIKREKSFVGCLAKMKVYIEDPESNGITIGGVPCRKLGTLKNGEVAAFQVGEESRKIYVISDTLSKDYCNDFYQLPEGGEYISLSGKLSFNPATGNAFRFNDNNSEGVAENRSRGAQRGIIVLIVAAIIGAIIGGSLVIVPMFSRAFLGAMSNAPVEDKTFTAGEMSITLTNKFSKSRQSGYEAVFASNDVAVFVMKESFADIGRFGSDYTTKSYAELLIDANDIVAKPKNDGERTYFEYNYYNPDDGITYYYIAYVYKTNNAFWSVTFAMDNEDSALYSGWVGSWARSVSFDE